MIGDPDNSRIYISQSQPAEGSEQDKIKASKTHIEVKADDNALEVKHIDGALAGIIYSVSGDFTPGSKLTLRAEVEGLPSVTAKSVIPEEIPEVRIGKSVDKARCTFSISVAESKKKDSFFGVQIMYRKVYEFIGNVPDDIKRQYQSQPVKEEFIGFNEISYNMELGDLSSIGSTLVAELSDQKTLMTPGIAEGSETIITVPVNRLYAGLVQSSLGTAPEDNYGVYEEYEYKVMLFRLTPEIYNHMKARKMAADSPLDPSLGFTPVTYTYTNVSDGLGYFGGVKTYVSEWSKFE